MRAGLLALTVIAACHSAVPIGNDEGAAGSTSTGASPSSSGAEVSTGPTTSLDGGSTGELEPEGCFVGPLPDVEIRNVLCSQPEPTPQAPGCGDGVRTPGELCYQGVATMCDAPSGWGGFFLADLGNGWAIGLPGEITAGISLFPATVAGVLGGPCTLEIDAAEHFVWGAAAIDWDGDGRSDLVTSQRSEDYDDLIALHRNVRPVVLELAVASPAIDATNLQLAEVDGIPPIDLVAGEDWGNGLVLNAFAAAVDGSFSLFDSVSPGAAIAAHAVADVDADGIDDLVLLVRPDDQTAELLLVLGSPAGYGVPTTLDEVGAASLGIPVLGRFDADDVPDLSYTLDGQLVVRAGLGDGTFAPPTITSLEVDYGLAAIDLDGDGRDELIGGGDVVSFTADGLPGLHIEIDIGYHNYAPRAVEAGELNGDGLLDFVILTDAGQAPPSIHLVLSDP